MQWKTDYFVNFLNSVNPSCLNKSGQVKQSWGAERCLASIENKLCANNIYQIHFVTHSSQSGRCDGGRAASVGECADLLYHFKKERCNISSTDGRLQRDTLCTLNQNDRKWNADGKAKEGVMQQRESRGGWSLHTGVQKEWKRLDDVVCVRSEGGSWESFVS